MPEKSALDNIDKGMQKVVTAINKQTNLRTADARQQEIDRQWAMEEQQWQEEQRKLVTEDRKEDKKVRDENLSTWGSIKAGFKAFNISLEHEKDNKITWGKLGSQLKDSVSEWYKQTKEMDNLLGKTFRLGSAVWENINTHLISHLKTAFSGVSSGIREVLGPVAEAFDAVKNAVIGVFGFFKGVFTSVFGKVKPEDKVRNKLLQGIVNYFKDEKKKDAREGVKKGKISTTFQILLLGLGIVIGAIVGAILAPLRILLKGLKLAGRIGKSILDLFGLGKFFDKIDIWVSTFIDKNMIKIKKLFGKGGKLAGLSKVLSKGGKFLKPLVAGFKIGFKVLGWPLTILLGVIDFIKGFWGKFQETGSISKSLIAGFKSAWMGFLGPFIDLFGWIFETILGFFGVEVEGTANKIKDFISELFDMVVLGWKLIFGGIGKAISGIVNYIKGEEKTPEEQINESYKKLSEQPTSSYFGQSIEQIKADKKAERERYQKKLKENDAKDTKDTTVIADAIKSNTAAIINNQTTVNQLPPEQISDEVDGSIANLTLVWDI